MSSHCTITMRQLPKPQMIRRNRMPQMSPSLIPKRALLPSKPHTSASYTESKAQRVNNLTLDTKGPKSKATKAASKRECSHTKSYGRLKCVGLILVTIVQQKNSTPQWLSHHCSIPGFSNAGSWQRRLGITQLDDRVVVCERVRENITLNQQRRSTLMCTILGSEANASMVSYTEN
jgi:hypothetical protein